MFYWTLLYGIYIAVLILDKRRLRIKKTLYYTGRLSTTWMTFIGLNNMEDEMRETQKRNDV